MTARRVVEVDDYAAFVRRIIRSFRTRAGADPEALALLAQVADEARAAVNEAIIACHAAGYSYAEIAARLGCTKQSVHERVSRQVRPDAQIVTRSVA